VSLPETIAVIWRQTFSSKNEIDSFLLMPNFHIRLCKSMIFGLRTAVIPFESNPRPFLFPSSCFEPQCDSKFQLLQSLARALKTRSISFRVLVYLTSIKVEGELPLPVTWILEGPDSEDCHKLYVQGRILDAAERVWIWTDFYSVYHESFVVHI
jgi:hypothetical protein